VIEEAILSRIVLSTRWLKIELKYWPIKWMWFCISWYHRFLWSREFICGTLFGRRLSVIVPGRI